MKIYFAGSIRGGRDDKKLYEKIIRKLDEYGEVMTEHIGDQDLDNSGEKSEETLIYKRDMKWLQSADYVVAEVTTPSLGVGYEIGKVENSTPILCLYRTNSDHNLSAMIAGNENIDLKQYKQLSDLDSTFDEFFESR